MTNSRKAATLDHMNKDQAIQILARWNQELRRDLRLSRYRVKKLEIQLGIKQGSPLHDLHTYWLDTQTPETITQIAAELEAVS